MQASPREKTPGLGGIVRSRLAGLGNEPGSRTGTPATDREMQSLANTMTRQLAIAIEEAEEAKLMNTLLQERIKELETSRSLAESLHRELEAGKVGRVESLPQSLQGVTMQRPWLPAPTLKCCPLCTRQAKEAANAKRIGELEALLDDVRRRQVTAEVGTAAPPPTQT